MNENEIQQAITEVEQLHEAIDGKQTLASAIKAGHILLTVKDSDSVQHGNWKQWVRDNMDVSYYSVVRYMRVAEYEELVKDCETFTGALDKIAKHRAEEKKQAKGEGDSTEPTVLEPDNEGEQTEETEATTAGEGEQRNRLIFAQTVQGTLMASGVNWDATLWGITPNKRPDSNDGSNNLVTAVRKLQHLISDRNYTSMTPKEEIEMKAEIVLETVLQFIIENTNKAEELQLLAA